MEVLYFHYFNSILLQHFSISGKILFLFLSLSFATLNSHLMDFPMGLGNIAEALLSSFNCYEVQ